MRTMFVIWIGVILASLVFFTVAGLTYHFLRQRGSPESKPVGAPHEATGVEG
jgi:hypothetical protein